MTREIELAGARYEPTQQKFHEIKILWDPAKQDIQGIQFKGGLDGEFRSWEFLKAVLEIAKHKVDVMAQMAMVQQQEQAMQAAMLAQKVQANGGIRY